jgi:hypothetical protein
MCAKGACKRATGVIFNTTSITLPRCVWLCHKVRSQWNFSCKHARDAHFPLDSSGYEAKFNLFCVTVTQNIESIDTAIDSATAWNSTWRGRASCKIQGRHYSLWLCKMRLLVFLRDAAWKNMHRRSQEKLGLIGMKFGRYHHDARGKSTS